MSERNVGIVKFFSTEKGYGFITPEEGAKDIYVHRSGLSDGVSKDDNGKPTLIGNQKVSYVIAASDREKGDGKMATQVIVEADASTS